MKVIKHIFIFLLALGTLTSCFDDDTFVDEVESTPVLIGFSNRTAAVSAVSDGQEYEKLMEVSLFGPSSKDITTPITATISVDPSSTAQEGVHYRLLSNEFTIGPDDNKLGNFPVMMLTDGIEPPLAANPVLVLNVTQATGDGRVIASGSQLVINMLYLCYADLAGTYVGTNDWCDETFVAEISPNPDGSWYMTVADGGFLHTCTSNTTLLNWGSINEVCGTIQPTANLRYGGLGIGVIQTGTWDQETGTLIMEHTDEFFNGGPYEWTSTYVRQ